MNCLEQHPECQVIKRATGRENFILTGLQSKQWQTVRVQRFPMSPSSKQDLFTGVEVALVLAVLPLLHTELTTVRQAGIHWGSLMLFLL